MKMRFSIAAVLVLLYSLTGNTQTQDQANNKKSQPYTLGLNYHYGFLLNHSYDRSHIDGLVLSNMQGLEASIQFHTLGTKDWHRIYNYPTWGMSLMFYNINDRVILDKNFVTQHVAWGMGFAWLIYKNIRLINTNFFKANLRLGTGFATFTKPYDAQDNPGNFWISSPINPSLHINLETKYRVSDQFQIVLGGTFTHFSNGATKMPNLGVNLPSVNVGLHYTPHPERIVYIRDTSAFKYKKNFLHISIPGGAKVLADVGTTYYPAFAASIHYGRRIGRVSKIFGGIDFFRDYSLLADSSVKKSGVDITRLGIFLGHEFMFGKAGLIFGMGRYLYKRTDRDAAFYIKTGLRYHFHPNVYGAIILKTHWGQADNIEWTVGYTL